MTPDDPPRMRRIYVDWLRGVAVVIMILAHTMDSWTRPDDRTTAAFMWQTKLAGLAAPLFLFLAGLGVSMSGQARLRKGEPVGVASRALVRRGIEIFGLALLFRLQAWVLSPGSSAAGLLRVDILNVMGPAMVIAAIAWGLSSRFWPRVVLLALVASAFSLLTPTIRGAAALAVLPDWLEWYLRPPPARAWFTMFPWAGLLVAGTVAGEVLERGRDPLGERRINLGLLLGGTLLFAVSWIGSYLPPLLANTSFWTTSPAYFYLRIGLMTAAIGAAYLYTRWRTPAPSQALIVLGRSSLFVYWVHVEMVYGLITYPIHHKLPIGWAALAFVAFVLFIFWLTGVKDRVMDRRKRAGLGRQPPVPQRINGHA